MSGWALDVGVHGGLCPDPQRLGVTGAAPPTSSLEAGPRADADGSPARPGAEGSPAPQHFTTKGELGHTMSELRTTHGQHQAKGTPPMTTGLSHLPDNTALLPSGRISPSER